MENKVVTVIIPVYNVERFLSQCVESVISQSYSNLQIILVDDGSTDTSGELCDQLKKRDERIEVLHKENGGLGSTRNAGIEKAAGSYIVFIDSDDWIDADHIQKMVDSIESTAADVVVTGYKRCKDEQGPFKKLNMVCSGCYDNVLEDVLLPMIAADESVADDVSLPVGSPFKLYKTEIIRDHDLRFTNEKECVSEDFFFNIDYLSLCKKAVVLEEYGYNYRYNCDSITRKYDPGVLKRTFRFYENLKVVLEKNAVLKERIGNRGRRIYIGKCRSAITLIVQSNLSVREKLSQIALVLSDDNLHNCLSEYPIERYNFYLRIVAREMKHKHHRIIFLLYSVRRIIRKGRI